MLSTQNSLVKQAKANENTQGFQNWNKQLAPSNEGMQSSMDNPAQLKSKEFQYNPNQKLMAIQKMANDSPNNNPLIQLKALATRYSEKKQPTLQLKPDNSGLPDRLKSGVENLSGLSMDDVKVHYNSDKPAQLNAHAYAQGTDIHLASGQEKHLPHEAWHVVQQKQGRVRPTMMMKAKVPINDDQGLEKEADIMGARAFQMKPFSLSDYRSEYSVQRKGVVQKVGGESSKEKPKPKKSSKENEWDTWNAEKNIWFKASEGIKDKTATDIPLPKHEGISKAFHTTTNEYAAKSILQRINPKFHNPASRFGGGFYVASDLATCYAELKAHEVDQFKDDYDKLKPGEKPQWLSAVHTIEYDVSGGDFVDCTGGELAKIVKDDPKSIEKKVREDKRDGIVFPSTKGSGMNIVLFQNYGILQPKSDKPTSAKEGFDKFKKEKLSEKIDKMEKNGDLSKENKQHHTGNAATL
jgi:hypothetical protein